MSIPHSLPVQHVLCLAFCFGAPFFCQADVLDDLQTHLAKSQDQPPRFDQSPFAKISLTKAQAKQAEKLLGDHHAQRIRNTRAEEMKAREVTEGKLKMPFFYQVFGPAPKDGRSLYISMHGGGGTAARVNDQQWENQKRLYQLEEGVYLVPRAPTNTWNLWHQSHIDGMFSRLIENLIVLENVNPNKVYVMGYSAGGDGVYQLAPRMADRFAAAAMMAGHPNETSPLGLRNLPFTLHVGERDAGYQRNEKARQWKEKLAELQKADPKGYTHFVKLWPNKGHWMDREDRAAIPWMAKYTRNPFPKKIVWKQDDVTHSRFYWLAVDPKDAKARTQVVATLQGQTIEIVSSDVPRFIVRLNDQMLDLDHPVTITSQGKTLFKGKASRTIETLAKTLSERGDAASVFRSEIEVVLPRPATK